MSWKDSPADRKRQNKLRSNRDSSSTVHRQPEDDMATFGIEEASLLLARGDGYFRVGYSRAGGFYARWKWTRGGLAGMYVYTANSSLGEALATVCNHAVECEEGKRKPSVDTPYRPR